MILYMSTAPEQGLTTPWGQNLDVKNKRLVTPVICYKFQKISLKSDFIQFNFCMILYMYLAPGKGEQPTPTPTPGLQSDFIFFFPWLNTCI